MYTLTDKQNINSNYWRIQNIKESIELKFNELHNHEDRLNDYILDSKWFLDDLLNQLNNLS